MHQIVISLVYLTAALFAVALVVSMVMFFRWASVEFALLRAKDFEDILDAAAGEKWTLKQSILAWRKLQSMEPLRLLARQWHVLRRALSPDMSADILAEVSRRHTERFRSELYAVGSPRALIHLAEGSSPLPPAMEEDAVARLIELEKQNRRSDIWSWYELALCSERGLNSIAGFYWLERMKNVRRSGSLSWMLSTLEDCLNRSVNLEPEWEEALVLVADVRPLSEEEWDVLSDVASYYDFDQLFNKLHEPRSARIVQATSVVALD